MKRLAGIATLLVVATQLGGCGKSEETASEKLSRYQPDTDKPMSEMTPKELAEARIINQKNNDQAARNAATEASSSSSARPDFTDQGKQLAWIDSSKESIKLKLKDPESAQFRDVKFYSNGAVAVACGEVNAKNGFGGYEGFQRFVAAGPVLQVLESDMAAGEMSKVWEQMCR